MKSKSKKSHHRSSAPSLSKSEKARLEFTRDDPRWWFSWKRVDILLRRVLPPSYNTWPRRWARAIELLITVRFQIPGDPRDGTPVYTHENAHKVLEAYAAGTGQANVVIALLDEAQSAARSEAARGSALQGMESVHRGDMTGKFRHRFSFSTPIKKF
jgi:hypothetical protein